MNPRVITAAPPEWHRRLLVVLVIGLHVAVGAVVMTIRAAHVIVTVVTATAVHAEQQLAARTGRPALSQTGIGVLAAAFVQEFLTTYRQPTR